MIALDDFAMNDPRQALTDIADILKVDVRTTSPEERAAMIKRYGPWRCRHAGRESRNARGICGRTEGRLPVRATSSAGRRP